MDSGRVVLKKKILEGYSVGQSVGHPEELWHDCTRRLLVLAVDSFCRYNKIPLHSLNASGALYRVCW